MSESEARDPAAALTDPVMLSLPVALDPVRAREAFRDACPALAQCPPIASIQVMRYRRARRCVIRYGFAGERWAVIGKLTAKGVHKRSLALQQRLHDTAFHAAATDGIHVPEPLGAVPDLGLWLQREVPGRPLQAMLGEPRAVHACTRAAAALAKLHRQPPGEARLWTVADELAVLDQRLPALAAARPDLADRVERLRARCQAAAARLPEAVATGIHRDFYPEQLIVDGEVVHLVDLDLYSLGDPALDAGNFLAHLIEAAIRTFGDPGGADPLVAAFRERFLAASPAVAADSVSIFTLLSLARLTQISSTITERHGATNRILAACEALAA